MKARFYCSECEEFKKGTEVSSDGYGEPFYCEECGSKVMQVRKLWKGVLKSFIDYTIAKKNEREFY